MKTPILMMMVLCLSLTAAQAQKMKTADDSLSYSLGMMIASTLKTDYGVIDPELFSAAFDAVMNGKATLITEDESQTIMKAGTERIKMIKAEENKKAGADFLANNMKRPEVTALPSGLQYEVIVMGDGAKPGAADKVRVHYHGTLIDGTVFDSSVDRGEPISFPLNRVIPGWTEGLQLMPVGSKWKLFIPYDLAYGDRAAGGQIKPYSTLIFEVELLDIE